MFRIIEGGVVEYDGESSEMTVKKDEVKPQTIVEDKSNIHVCSTFPGM